MPYQAARQTRRIDNRCGACVQLAGTQAVYRSLCSTTANTARACQIARITRHRPAAPTATAPVKSQSKDESRRQCQAQDQAPTHAVAGQVYERALETGYKTNEIPTEWLLQDIRD